MGLFAQLFEREATAFGSEMFFINLEGFIDEFGIVLSFVDIQHHH